MNEQKKYEVIKKLVDENGNKDRAALTLGITKRQVYRLIKIYKQKGKIPSNDGSPYLVVTHLVFSYILPTAGRTNHKGQPLFVRVGPFINI